jgi:hypothetical protein
MRSFLSPLLILGLVIACPAADKAPLVTVRLHAEGKESDGKNFGTPVTLINPPKKIIMHKVPVVTEKDFTAFYPFPTQDGTLGAYFKLDPHGTNKLAQHTTEFRDTLAVVLINGRVACALMVDRKINDGILYIPSGFLSKEIAQLQTTLPTVGKERDFPEQKKKALAALKADQKKEPKPKPTPKAKPTPKPAQ